MGSLPTSTVLVVLVTLIASFGDCSPSPVLDFLDPFLPQDDVNRQNQGGLNKELSASGAAAGHVGADLGGVGFDAGGALAGSKSLELHKNKGPIVDNGYYPPPQYQRPLPPPQAPCNHGPQPRPLGPQPYQHQPNQQYRPNQIPPHQPHYRNTAEMDGPDNSPEDLVAVDFDKDGDVDADDVHAMAVMNGGKGKDKVKAKRDVVLLMVPMTEDQNATANATNSTQVAKAKRNLDAQFAPLPQHAQYQQQQQYQNQPGRQTAYANNNAPARRYGQERIISPKFRRPLDRQSNKQALKK